MSTKTRAAARQKTPGIEAFEKAVRTFGRKEYHKAEALFDEIVTSYPEERDLIDRARAYKAICGRVEEKPAPKPRGFEDLLHQGIYEHNRGAYDVALRYFEEAAQIHPRNDHVLYCIAASQARRGDEAAALTALQAAVRIDSANAAQARHDPDFESLRGEDGFFDALAPAEEA